MFAAVVGMVLAGGAHAAVPRAGERMTNVAQWAAPNPFRGVALWREPDDPAQAQVREWSVTRPRDAEALRRIADTPRAVWLGDWTEDPAGTAEEITRAARARGELPVLVAYAIPDRDCGGQSAGGVADARRYAAWVGALTRGIGDRPAVVVLEPDALAQVDCLSGDALESRLTALRGAVTTLSDAPAAVVYLDAGNAAWTPAPRMADLLLRAGLRRARGFAVNVAGSRTDAESVAYGRAISRRVGGARFVVDTGRNGNGPVGGSAWCNVPGLALGRSPGAGPAPVDAWLWIKRPGESDGACGGGPQAGAWWPERALELAAG